MMIALYIVLAIFGIALIPVITVLGFAALYAFADWMSRR
jgi:hypothetical protein